ncbi:MAG: nuclear transport factor 2 family protein [Cyanobacteria bacterium P01_H01_bin.119]
MASLRPLRRPIYALLLSLALGWATPQMAKADSPETAPSELTTALSAITDAAEAEDLDGVMAYYSPSFVHADGFDQASYAEALEQFWSAYDGLSYRVEIQSWERDGSAIVAETITYVSGQQISGNIAALESVVRSRQRFENGQIVFQEVLAERNQLTAGITPPNVTIQLPEEVSLGDEFNFDAIVEEPLGNRLLIGAAIDEGVTSEDFFEGRPLDLDLLSAGGLFKVGNAPEAEDDRWISALLIREDGLIVITRRLRVR